MIHGILLWSFAGIVWGVLSVVVFLGALLMTAVILIQDSKDTGLTSAFGGGGSSNALLGARMQRDLAKITAILAGVLALCLVVMGVINRHQLGQSIGELGAGTGSPTSAVPAAAGAAGTEGGLPAEAPFPGLPAAPSLPPPDPASTPTGTAPGTPTGTAPAAPTDTAPAPTDTAPAPGSASDPAPGSAEETKKEGGGPAPGQ